ncbi:hypothetical protein H6G80_26710 [Nostoc sp. FACHB-87]|uniref:hypothetical protein n=1 Tax=Nostocaceae TaxID=1162 RepID=UPI001688CAD3|nr:MULTISPECIES: hypothetical protein [Nostocaceae]MBD2299317.1 hypothetical protein [Nostoc sp. FACHB-190]MBD2457649.1 hypothetical protein [Nostoc sp. FACHB-87]MBD2478940.1 hypothetical protein [Anabaena sp. FACHB-83]
MQTQTIANDLLLELSNEQQQFLSGGQSGDVNDDDLANLGNNVDSGSFDRDSSNRDNTPLRRYRINSRGTAIITVQKLS